MELYFQLDERAQGVHPDSAIAGPITCSQLKLSTSLKLGTGEGTIFDTTIQSFKKIRSNAGDLLQRAIRYPFPTAFRAYLTQAQWTTVGQDSQSCKSLFSHPNIPNSYESLIPFESFGI